MARTTVGIVLDREASGLCRLNPQSSLLKRNKLVDFCYMDLHFESRYHSLWDFSEPVEQKNTLAVTSQAPQAGNHADTHREARSIAESGRSFVARKRADR
jgi:hypothetical protein